MIKVIGAGLAGCEAAYFLAEAGHEVQLYDIKPSRFTPAHSDKNFGELVCSNSLKGNDPYANACGLLKQEMRELGSLIIEAADATRVPAGGALAVDRTLFAQYITHKIRSHGNIKVVCEEIKALPSGEWCIVATGPLTCDALACDIKAKLGGDLHFYDASAPIVSRDSIDMSLAFFGDRYGRGGDDYINCPMTKEEYELFVRELTGAERAVLHDFERGEIFEGCMPLEVMAARGEQTLRFGPFKPVGLRDSQGNKYYAVLQLRKENAEGQAYNLVGCQTNLKFPEQKRVFSLIPALRNAQFLRYGVMHRNTYINSPDHLNADFSYKADPKLFFAGQMTGVEGYVESAASGLLCALHMHRKLCGKAPAIPANVCVLGALSAHISGANQNFTPMNANFGILKAGDRRIRDKKARYTYLATRSLGYIAGYKLLIKD
ncbi:MAG TPA: methylenetetrahydrofolate--tRNA-(uracil(54)-C(5))-methyltransferase (FADH(2)-oxidizing) TrmFO [Candidatus Coproplasma avicola]|uniref:Methylenetetrahydrofolate--tRNA-(uracil-5-)-methyltransferase TrmFO n=1 Tax=Candidatus Coproplasma avicola TaxID=2840744 RepID=A0A9D1E5V2_9FIRM|nr:methylenetetrahydrofolate--tRNA-(uracil(54)-C(5))-methyltransferase (FADH(2)-oxidizing) TrmFO [Candidatus Coproplasma avicola]